MTPQESAGDTLAAAIIAVRKQAGSQAKLAELVGVTERTVKRWERGAVPRDAVRDRLVSLGVDRRLFEDADEREQIERRLRDLEAEIARIRELLA